MNRDSIADMIVGARGRKFGTPYTGESYVIFGVPAQSILPKMT